MILTIRTDKPEAEIGLYEADGKRVSYKVWHAHRALSTTILSIIRDELQATFRTFTDITGVVVFRGPGSFTGLRIGITIANTLSYGLSVPITGSEGDNWQEKGIRRLSNGESDHIVMPNYGAEAHATPPRK